MPPRTPTNNQKWNLILPELDSCEKLIFAVPSFRKPGFKSPRHPDFEPKINTKSGLEASPKQKKCLALGVQKTFKMVVPNRLKIHQISTPDPHMSFLLLSRTPRVPPRSQSTPSGCQNASTRPPKSQFWALKMTTNFCFGNNKCFEN